MRQESSIIFGVVVADMSSSTDGRRHPFADVVRCFVVSAEPHELTSQRLGVRQRFDEPTHQVANKEFKNLWVSVWPLPPKVDLLHRVTQELLIPLRKAAFLRELGQRSERVFERGDRTCGLLRRQRIDTLATRVVGEFDDKPSKRSPIDAKRSKNPRCGASRVDECPKEKVLCTRAAVRRRRAQRGLDGAIRSGGEAPPLPGRR